MIMRDSETGIDRRMTWRQAGRELLRRAVRFGDSGAVEAALLLAALTGAAVAFIGGC